MYAARLQSDLSLLVGSCSLVGLLIFLSITPARQATCEALINYEALHQQLEGLGSISVTQANLNILQEGGFARGFLNASSARRVNAWGATEASVLAVVLENILTDAQDCSLALLTAGRTILCFAGLALMSWL